MGLGVQTKRRLLLHKTPYLYLQPAIPRNARPLGPLPGPQRPLEAVLAPNTVVSQAGYSLGWEPECERRAEITQTSEWKGWTGKFASIRIKSPIWH